MQPKVQRAAGGSSPDKNNPREAEPGLAAPRHERRHRGDRAGHRGRVLHPQPPSLLPSLALKSAWHQHHTGAASSLPAGGTHPPCAPMHGAGLRGGTTGPRHLPTSPRGLSVPQFPRGFGVSLELGWERGPASPGAPAAPDPCCRGQAARGFLPRFLPLTARSPRCLARAPAAPPAPCGAAGQHPSCRGRPAVPGACPRVPTTSGCSPPPPFSPCPPSFPAPVSQEGFL